MNRGLGKSVIYVSTKGITIVEIITIAIQKGPKCLAISVCTAVAGGQCDSVVLTMGTAVCKMVYGPNVGPLIAMLVVMVIAPTWCRSRAAHEPPRLGNRVLYPDKHADKSQELI